MRRLLAISAMLIVLAMALVSPARPGLVRADDRCTDNVPECQTVVANLESTVSALQTTVAKLKKQVKKDKPTPTPNTTNAEGIASLGENVQTENWRVRVKDATVLPTLGDGFGDLMVILEVTNTGSEDRRFGEPNDTFYVTSDDGRKYGEDLLKSAQAAVANGDWTGNFAPGKTYDFTVVFTIPKADPQVYPNDPKGWVLSYFEGGDAGTEYRFDLGL
jgi:hypothetical protein